MTALNEKLLQSHFDHIMAQLKRGGLKEIITREISIAFEYTHEIQLKEIITPEQITGLIRRLVVELPIAGGITELAGETSRTVLASRHNKNITLEALFPPGLYDDIVDKVISLEKPRNELIRRLISSSLCKMLISDILYSGIFESLLSDQNPLHRLPGVAPIIKIWGWALEGILPNLKPTIEKRIRQYIEDNVDAIIQHSQTFLIEALNDERIAEMGDELKQSIGPHPLSKYFEGINADDMEDFILIGYDFWLNFRKTQYFEGLYKELVDYFFEKYGDKSLDVIIEDVGVSKALITSEVIEMMTPSIEKIIENDYIRQRIQAFLESFYNSQMAIDLIREG